MSRRRKTAWFIITLCATTGIASQAQTFANLVTFDITNGAYPYGTLVQGLDGNMYGITAEGGRQRCNGGCGTIFNVTPEGALTIVHPFVGTDGAYPVTGLVMAASGNFYGSTFGKSPQASGTEPSYFFELAPNGTLTNLQVGGSSEPLVQDTSDGNFYGTSVIYGGGQGYGTIFKMTAAGALSTLHSFCQLRIALTAATLRLHSSRATTYSYMAPPRRAATTLRFVGAAAQSSKLDSAARWIGCTLSTGLMARIPNQDLCRPQTATSTEQPFLVGKLTTAPSSKLHPGERSRACTSFVR